MTRTFSSSIHGPRFDLLDVCFAEAIEGLGGDLGWLLMLEQSL